MSKIIVCPQSKKDITLFLSKEIDAILLSIDGLSVNSNFYVTIEYLENNIKKIKNNEKEIFVSLNKIMHNKDLPLLEGVLKRLKNINIDKILFYDLAVLNMAKKLNMTSYLAIYQNHLNNSMLSNSFYFNEGVKTSVLSNELSKEEIIKITCIKNMSFILNVYGYLPIFYSKRSLLTSYFKHIKKRKKDRYYYLLDDTTNNKHIITEESEGTTVYYSDKINLDIEFHDFINKKIDYVILQSNFISTKEYLSVIDTYINIKNNKQVEFTDSYKGFMYNKPYFKVNDNE